MCALLDHVTIFLVTLFVIVPRSILAREAKVNLSGIWYVLLPTAYDTICSWRHTTSLAVEVCFQVCLLCALQCLTYQCQCWQCTLLVACPMGGESLVGPCGFN